MNGGKPCEGNDTETARSCFAPCPGMSFVKKTTTTNISSPSELMRMSFTYSFIYSSFFFAKNCSEINFIEVQKNALKLKYCFFPVLGLLLYRF